MSISRSLYDYDCALDSFHRKDRDKRAPMCRDGNRCKNGMCPFLHLPKQLVKRGAPSLIQPPPPTLPAPPPGIPGMLQKHPCWKGNACDDEWCPFLHPWKEQTLQRDNPRVEVTEQPPLHSRPEFMHILPPSALTPTDMGMTTLSWTHTAFPTAVVPTSLPLVPCGKCGRTFTRDRVERHQACCQTAGPKRSVFDAASRRRPEGAEEEDRKQTPGPPPAHGLVLQQRRRPRPLRGVGSGHDVSNVCEGLSGVGVEV